MNSNMQPEMIVHLGAHKTASTHFSRMIRRTRIANNARFLAQPRKDTIRSNLTRLLSVSRNNQGAASEDAVACRYSLIDENEITDEVTKIFVSDENIIGTPPLLFDEVKMYPRAVKRLRSMVSLVGREKLTCYLAIREPATFISSAYAETVRYGEFITRECYLKDAPLEAMRWIYTIRGICNALDGIPLLVWTFEDYPRVQNELARRIMGDVSDRWHVIPKPKDKVREGMSQKAIEVICEENNITGGPISRDRVEAIMRAYPKSETFPPPQLFSRNERAVLARNYRKDLKAIARLENVTMMPDDCARSTVRRVLNEIA